MWTDHPPENETVWFWVQRTSTCVCVFFFLETFVSSHCALTWWLHKLPHDWDDHWYLACQTRWPAKFTLTRQQRAMSGELVKCVQIQKQRSHTPLQYFPFECNLTHNLQWHFRPSWPQDCPVVFCREGERVEKKQRDIFSPPFLRQLILWISCSRRTTITLFWSHKLTRHWWQSTCLCPEFCSSLPFLLLSLFLHHRNFL